MIRKTKVYFIHRFISGLDDFLRVIQMPNVVGSLEWNENSPDILFATEWIYYDKICYKEFCKLWPKAKLRVFLAFEAIYPDMNLFDYAVGFNNHLNIENDRFIRLMSPLHFFSGFISSYENEVKTIEDAKRCLNSKTGFCNFLYSNGHAHPMRDRLFFELSKYKKVDSWGRHLNNIGRGAKKYSPQSNWRKDSSDIKAAYKFSIASENACFRGYTSEKIYTSLLAHTIPIYWGNPDVCEEVNPEAFINVNDYDSMNALLERIEYIDQHDDIWMDMVSKPWMTVQQLEQHTLRTEAFKKRMKDILFGDIEPNQRLSQGTHQDCYRNRFFHNSFMKSPKIFVIKRLLNEIGVKI